MCSLPDPVACAHDLDRTLRSQESENERYDFEADLFGESESDYEDPSYEMSEEDELDLAAERAERRELIPGPGGGTALHRT